MSELQFRITVIPEKVFDPGEKNRLLSEMKYAVGNCGVKVVSIDFFQVPKSEYEDYPEIEELSIEVHVKPGNTYPKDTRSQYYQFCCLYSKLCSRPEKQFSAVSCSYVVLYSNACFTYPRILHLRHAYNRLSFGVLPHNGLYHEYARLISNADVVDFYHDTRHVIISYSEFVLRFSYDNIRNVFVNINRSYEILIDLFNPPIIFRDQMVLQNGMPLHKLKYRNLNLSPITLEWDDEEEEYFLDDCSPQIDTDILGRANVLSLHFAESAAVQQIIDGIHFHCSHKSVYYSCISSRSKAQLRDPVLQHVEDITFGCTYLLTALFKRNFVMLSQTYDIRNNLRHPIDFCRKNPDCFEKALTCVLSALDAGKIVNFWHAIETQYNYYLSNKDEINYKEYIVPPNTFMIRRITLTPTRQLLWPPEIMDGNRVLRNFDTDYFLRVSFREDDMESLSHNAMHADNHVLPSCIEIPMTRGIHIGSRCYAFLACSNSQLHNHGVWMYAKDLKGNNAKSIRRWMGDFSHIHKVPKYMARMGQCFSSTEDVLSVPLDSQYVRTERDIEGGYDLNGKPYCFSDGVGRISTKLASKVHDALKHDKLCSAFQIRYGGYKGMLVVDPSLKDGNIVFRDSMNKFDSPQNRLEIAMTSKPVPVKLNRPLIMILDNLGVKHSTFLKLQDKRLKTLSEMLSNEKKAFEFLRSCMSNKLFPYEELSRSGIGLTTEPFFKSFLIALNRHHIGKLKKKANIAIDPSKGRTMLGVMDEIGILKYGQVFVQYTTDISQGRTTKDTSILKGEVLVTKNPCLFAGDVRKFQAVDVPDLHHIVDCIVFPRKGTRPHSNEMAGSDLDGDQYSVIWLADLIFPGPNARPADFPAIETDDETDVTVPDMINFLQTYIQNDPVGLIANAHLAFADRKGIHSEICVSIAEKFSIAIDFAKNGEFVDLDSNERPHKFPDFMEKHSYETYKSKKALGKLYRKCKDFEYENENTTIMSYHNIKVDRDLICDGWEKYKEDAEEARNKYNGLFGAVLRNYGIEHEVHALSGTFTNLHYQFRRKNDRRELGKIIIGRIRKLHKSMLKEFREEFYDYGNVDETMKEMYMKASAWYVVTYSDPDAKILSFPWIVSNFLADIKIGKYTKLPSQPFISMPSLICKRGNFPRYVDSMWNDNDLESDKQMDKRWCIIS